MKIFKPKTEKIQKDFVFLYSTRDLDHHHTKSSFSISMMYPNSCKSYLFNNIVIGYLDCVVTTRYKLKRLRKKVSYESSYQYASTTFLSIPFKLFK